MNARQESIVSTQATTKSPTAVGRLGRLLEENGTVVVVVAAFAAILITHLRTALSVDGWMALLSGRVVAEHGLPSHDMLTVWTHGRPWVDQQWLAQLVLYKLEQLGGLPLVLLVHAAIVTGAFGGAALLARRLGGSARSVTWVSLPVLFEFWRSAAIMRPQTFAYALFVAVLWLLLDESRKPSRRIYLALPLLVLWANLHGSVVVGAALVSGFAVCEIAGSLWARPRSVRGRSVVLLVAPWVCLLASPYATSLPHYYRLVFSSGFSKYVTEWAPTTLSLLDAPAYLLAFGGFWLIGRTAGRTSAFEKLAFAGMSVLALDAVRNIVWLALLSLILLPRLLDTLRAPAVEPKRMNRLLALAMLAGVAVATIGVALEPTSWFTQQYSAKAGAAAAAAAGSHGRVFADERYADWLAFEHPQLEGRIAYDSRFELLSSRQLQLIPAFRNLVTGWQGTLRGYSVFVLDKSADAKPIKALLSARQARVVTRRGPIVVLQRR